MNNNEQYKYIPKIKVTGWQHSQLATRFYIHFHFDFLYFLFLLHPSIPPEQREKQIPHYWNCFFSPIFFDFTFILPSQIISDFSSISYLILRHKILLLTYKSIHFASQYITVFSTFRFYRFIFVFFFTLLLYIFFHKLFRHRLPSGDLSFLWFTLGWIFSSTKRH